MKRLILTLTAISGVCSLSADNKEYDYVSDFQDGAAVARHNSGEYYMINRSFERINTQGYDYMADFVEGWPITSVREGDKSGFVDVKGELIGELDYDMIRVINDKMFECSKDGRSFLADTYGERVNNNEFDYLQYIQSGDYFIAQMSDLWITLDSNGDRLSNIEFEYLIALKDDNLIALKKGEWKRVTPKGEWLGKIDLFDYVKFNKWGLGVLPSVRKCTIVDEAFAIIDDRFDDILEFSDRGLFRFRRGSMMGYIDGRARELVPAAECVAGEYRDGIAVVFDPATKSYKAYNLKGEEAFDASIYESLSDFNDSSAVVRKRGDSLYGIISTKGDWTCDAIYDQIVIDPDSNRRYKATKGDKTITIDKNGKEK